MIKSAGLISLRLPHPLKQCSFSRVEVGGGMQWSRWVMALLTSSSLVPSHGSFLQSSSWVWELPWVSLTSLQFVSLQRIHLTLYGLVYQHPVGRGWGYGSPYKAQHSSHSSVVRSRVTSAELRNPGLTLWLKFTQLSWPK